MDSAVQITELVFIMHLRILLRVRLGIKIIQ